MIRTVYDNFTKVTWDQNVPVISPISDEGMLLSNKIPQFIAKEGLDAKQKEIWENTVKEKAQKVIRLANEGIHLKKHLAQGAFGVTYMADLEGAEYVIKLIGVRNSTQAKEFEREVIVQIRLAEKRAAPQIYGAWLISTEAVINYDYQAYGVVVMERMHKTLDKEVERLYEKYSEVNSEDVEPDNYASRKEYLDAFSKAEAEADAKRAEFAKQMEDVTLAGMRSIELMQRGFFMHMDFKSDNIMFDMKGRILPIDFGGSQQFDPKTKFRTHAVYGDIRAARDMRQYDPHYDPTNYAWIEYYVILKWTEGLIRMESLKAQIDSEEGQRVVKNYAFFHGWWDQISDHMMSNWGRRKKFFQKFLPIELNYTTEQWYEWAHQPPVTIAWQQFFSTEQPEKINQFIENWPILYSYAQWPISDDLKSVLRRAGVANIQVLISALMERDAIQPLLIDWLNREMNFRNVMLDYLRETKGYVPPETIMPGKRSRSGDEGSGRRMKVRAAFGEDDPFDQLFVEMKKFTILVCVIVSRMGMNPLIEPPQM